MFFTILATGILVTSCDKNNEGMASTSELTLNLAGLDELGDDFVYEGWIIVNGAPVSTGTFSSVTFPQSFTVDADELTNATKFVLSIEPAVDSDPAPAATKILAGDFSGDQAIVNSNGIVADFGASSGKYILATPTNGSDNDERSGVWFLDLSSGSPTVGLDLPVLPNGWKYEGWSVINGMPVSSGTFTDVNDFDDNAATTLFKGDMGDGPAFPGEDYLQNAPSGLTFPTDLRGATIVVSVEPYPDNSPAPFTLKPLAHVVPSDAVDHVTLTMGTGPVVSLSGNVMR
ncbi:anti-sigma factor [Thalassobellus sediminis]|uniref:anti-sigma factor n=1 Tax=Thalassobellus sediminis TaxID=3367753 RepID=UPI0037AAC3F8